MGFSHLIALDEWPATNLHLLLGYLLCLSRWQIWNLKLVHIDRLLNQWLLLHNEKGFSIWLSYNLLLGPHCLVLRQYNIMSLWIWNVLAIIHILSHGKPCILLRHVLKNLVLLVERVIIMLHNILLIPIVVVHIF